MSKKSTAATDLAARPRIYIGHILQPAGCASKAPCVPAPLPAPTLSHFRSNARPRPRPLKFSAVPMSRVFLSRRGETMPYFVRNADGDELYFVHAAGRFETDYGNPTVRTRRLYLHPKRHDLSNHSRASPSCFSSSKHPPLWSSLNGVCSANMPYSIRESSSSPNSGNPVERRKVRTGNGRCASNEPANTPRGLSLLSDGCRRLERRPLGRQTQRERLPPRHECPLPSPAQRPCDFSGRWSLVSTFAPRPLESDPKPLRVPFYHRNMDYDEVLFYHQGNFFQPGRHTARNDDPASAGHPPRSATAGNRARAKPRQRQTRSPS